MNSRTIATFTIAAGLGVSITHAAPPALDYVPEGAIMVAAVDDLGRLGGNMRKLLVALGLDDAAQSVGMGTMMMGGMGVKPSGSGAMFVMDGDLGALQQGQGPVAVIVEMTDYDTFITNFGGDPAAAVARFNLNGTPAFSRRLENGFVALGPDRATVEAIQAAGGRAGAVARWSGAVGRDVTADSNIVLMADMQALRPFLDEGMDRFNDGLEQARRFGGDQAAAGAGLARTVVETFMRDASIGVIGLNVGESGVAIDIAAQFEEGSELAGYFARRGEAGGMLARLPQVPVLLAAAFDSSHPGVRRIVSNLAEFQQQLTPGAPPNQVFSMVQAADGGAIVIGNSAALLSGGLFSNSALYLKTGEPRRVLDANAEALRQADGAEQQGMTMRTSYRQGALTVAGVPVDSWSAGMQLDPDAPGSAQAQMAIMAIFGPTGGPSGYMAGIDGGVVGTLSQNRRLLETAINAARAGDGLSSHPQMREATANMRPGSIAEIYIGLGNILSTVTSAMGMFGMDLDVDIPDDIGNVPLAIGANNGGVRVRTFLSTNVLVTVSELVGYFQAMQGMGGGMDWGMDDGGF